jgi:hypothetical protein
MADPSQYFVHPDTGEVGIVPTEEVALARERGFSPASDTQIKQYDARKEVDASPISSALKSIGEQALELIAPTGVLRGAALMGGLRAKEEADIARTGREIMASARGVPVAPPTALETSMEATAKPLLKAAEVLEPVTPTGAMLAAGVTTPERIEARREALGRVPEIVPFVGGAPVTSLLSLGAAVAGPAGLARLGKSLSGKSLGIKALAAEETAASARANALAVEAGAGAEAAAIQKASENAALKVVEAADSAAARRALLAKVPGGERIAQGIEKALRVPDEASALNLVSKVAGGPVALGTEERVRSLAALLPGLKSSPVLQNIVAKAAAQSAGSAADLALFSLGTTSQEDLLGDHKMTAERALANMGHAIVDGAFLGAIVGGLPPATNATLSQFGKGVRGLNKWFEKNVVRRGAGVISEAEPSSIDMLAERRADLDRPVGEILAEELERRQPLAVAPPVPLEPSIRPIAYEPGLPPQVIVPELGMTPATMTRPVVKFPEMEPEAPMPMPAAPVVPELKPVELERATMDLWSTIKDAKRAMIKAEKQFTPIREAEESVLIDRYYNEEAIPKAFQGPMLQQVMKEIGGRKATPRDQVILDRLRDNIEQIPRSRAVLIGDEILGRVKALGELDTGTLPLGVMKRAEALAKQMQALGQGKRTPAQVASAADKVARELFELGKPPSDNVTMTLQEQRASRLAFDAGHLVRDFLIDPEMFGPAAARELSIRTNLTRVNTALKNFDSLFSKKRFTGVKKFIYEPDPGKIQTYLQKRGKPSAVLGDQAINDLREAMTDLYADMRQSAAYYQGETMVPQVGERLSAMAKALNDAEAQVALAASNTSLKQEFNVRQKEFEGIKREIAEQQAARNAQRADIERRVKDADEERATQARIELERWRIDNEVKTKEAKQRIDAWETREAARQAEIDRQQAEFDAAVKERKEYVGEQSKSLSQSSPDLFLKTVLRYTPGAPTNVVKAYKAYAALEKAAKKVEVWTKDAAKAIVKTDRLALAAIKPPNPPRSIEQERKQYAERTDKLLRLAGDPDAMVDHLDAVTAATADSAPKISGHIKDVTSTGVMALVNAVPAPPANLPPYRRAAWKPTDSQMREFNRKYDAVTNPMGVLYRVGEGSATQDEIKLIDQVYSTLMRDVRQNVIDTLGDDKEIPASRRLMLSKVLGLNIDGAPALGMTAQSVYGNAQQPPPQSKQQIPLSRAKSLGVAGRESRETAAWREAQPQGAEARMRGVGSRF